ncbi:HAD family hydrolase [Micromonospora ureilytica]|uniref:Beta-phosphoglucomutase-like phosphatase (HAD superfamily) n=1 Tax=Micromonospora ureilytica TaxID=709868 RepID=A0ABS0JCV3_9ACTN|nr:beta-phosphoglucomutase-like phosphatase (HAD superfamily) [Micromonospora ureilytica]
MSAAHLDETGRALDRAVVVLRAMAYEHRIQILVDSSQVRRGKPGPECYLRAAHLLNTTAASCLVIEDSPAGIEAARVAGMTRALVGLRPRHHRSVRPTNSSVAASMDNPVP